MSYEDHPPNAVKDVKVQYRYDPYGKEWVVTLHKDNGYSPVCGCPGEFEAKLASQALAFALAMFDISWDMQESVYITDEGSAFNRVSINEESLDAFFEAKELGEDLAAMMKDFCK